MAALRPLLALTVLTLCAASLGPVPNALSDEKSASCRSPLRRAAFRAIEAWCSSKHSVERPYYDWPAARTKRRSCVDLRAAASRCDSSFRDSGLEGEQGHFVVVDFVGPEATYWQADLEGDSRAMRVTKVDFYEDCTGP